MGRSALGKAEKTAIAVTAVGGVFEFYDFIVFIYVAPVIADLFFPPEQSDFIQRIQTFGIFAIGYLARPLGGFVFGHFGDTRGRKRTFTLSLFMMAIPTFAIGCLPTYSTVGLWAPFGLIALRIIQGVSLGGEVPGAITFLAEHAPTGRRGFTLSILCSAVIAGVLLGSAVGTILNLVVTDEEMLSYAWRLPFFFGGFLAIVGFFARRRLVESPSFKELQEHGEVERQPLKVVMEESPAGLARGFVFSAYCGATVAIFYMYMPTFLDEHAAISQDRALALNTLGLLVWASYVPVMGNLSDKIGRRRVLGFGAIGLAILAIPVVWMLHTIGASGAIGGYLLLSVVAGTIGPFLAVLAEEFPTSVRYSGVAISYNLGMGIVGGTAPLVATALIEWTGMVESPGVYVVCWALLAAIAAKWMRETNALRLNEPRV